MRIEQFISLATTTPSADNGQPWCFSIDRELLSISYCHRSNKPDPFGAFGHASLISGGALHETIINLLGLGGQSENQVTVRTNDLSWFLDIPLQSISLANSCADYSSVTSRHTNRHPFKSLDTDLLQFSEADSGCQITLSTHRPTIKQIASCLRSCSEARFNNRELHEWLFSSIRWTDEEAMVGSGLDIATLHLPPGGRQLMRWIAPWKRMAHLNRLGFYKVMALVDSSLFCAAPAILAFSGKTDRNDIWNTGRSIQRTWIQLNQQGIAVHPYYAITDLGNRLRNGELDANWELPVKSSQEIIKQLLKLDSERELHMLFRIGSPTVTPVRSRRLPTASFIPNLA